MTDRKIAPNASVRSVRLDLATELHIVWGVKTAVLSVRLPRRSRKELERVARRWGRTPGEVAGSFVDESLRTCAFANLEFRSTPAGRVPYLAGSRLAIHQVVSLLREFRGNIAKTAKHLRVPPALVRTAQLYAKAYPAEIDDLLRDNRRGFEALRRLLPGLERS